MDKIAFKITEDGSHTLYLEELDETYHSKHGAIQEAMHVFIDAGLNYSNKSELNIWASESRGKSIVSLLTVNLTTTLPLLSG